MIAVKKGYESLSGLEKEYAYWVNRMRQNPGKFGTEYIKPFLSQFPEAVSEESRSLMKEIAILPSLQILYPVSNINIAAANHAEYLATIGRISHDGRNGSTFQTRMKDAGVKICAGEVIFDGKEDILMGLILLLIDHGVPGLGHRKALLNPDFGQTGIAIRYTREKRAILVQDLACPQAP